MPCNIKYPERYICINAKTAIWRNNFYRAMLHRVRICHGKLSVRLFVTLRYRNHVGWNSSKIISRLVSLGCSLSADPNVTGLLQGEHPRNFGRNRGRVRKKVAFGVQKL